MTVAALNCECAIRYFLSRPNKTWVSCCLACADPAIQAKAYEITALNACVCFCLEGWVCIWHAIRTPKVGCHVLQGHSIGAAQPDNGVRQEASGAKAHSGSPGGPGA